MQLYKSFLSVFLIEKPFEIKTSKTGDGFKNVKKGS